MSHAHAASLVRAAMMTALLAAGLAPAGAGEPDHEAVGEAIAHAVADRLRVPATVAVRGVQTAVLAEGALTASPEPGARIGAAARFVLFDDGTRVGTAIATVDVTAAHVRTRRAIARGEPLEPDDLEEVEGSLDGQIIRRVPARADLVGARARRNLAAGEAIVTGMADVPPLVRSGDQVTAVLRVGAVEAEGRATASGSGHLGDVIRLVFPAMRKPLSARITGPGTVEIIP